VGIDRAVGSTMSEVRKWLETKYKSRFKQEIEELTYFIPWDIEANIPKIHVDASSVSLDTIWLA